MESDPIVTVELAAIIVTLLGGFGGMWYRLGKRERDLDAVSDALSEVKADVVSHEKHCIEREKEVLDKLSQGSSKFATLEERVANIGKDVKELKDMFVNYVNK